MLLQESKMSVPCPHSWIIVVLPESPRGIRRSGGERERDRDGRGNNRREKLRYRVGQHDGGEGEGGDKLGEHGECEEKEKSLLGLVV